MSTALLEIPHEVYTLSNGLTVILHADHTLPQVVVNVRYNVGSRHERAGRSGFAHLFEHLMFMGTERVPGSSFDDHMEAHGGWNNAWTAEDATNYTNVGPSHLVEMLLWLEADRMDGLARSMTQEKLDKQREVVRNERRQTVEDAPYGRAWNALPELGFPCGHPYAHSVIGSHEDLVAATVADVRDFFTTWYVPNNAILTVGGDIDCAAVRACIERFFGGISSRKLPERAVPSPPTRTTPKQASFFDHVQLPMSVLTWHTPPAYANGDATFDVLAAVLSDGRSSRLYSHLIHDTAMALEAQADQHSLALSSQFYIELTPSDGVKNELVEQQTFSVLKDVATHGPRADELERVRNQLEIGFLQRLESLQSRTGSLSHYQAMLGSPASLNRDLQRYRSVTSEDVQAAATALQASTALTVRVYPTTHKDNPANTETLRGNAS